MVMLRILVCLFLLAGVAAYAQQTLHLPCPEFTSVVCQTDSGVIVRRGNPFPPALNDISTFFRIVHFDFSGDSSFLFACTSHPVPFLKGLYYQTYDTTFRYDLVTRIVDTLLILPGAYSTGLVPYGYGPTITGGYEPISPQPFMFTAKHVNDPPPYPMLASIITIYQFNDTGYIKTQIPNKIIGMGLRFRGVSGCKALCFDGSVSIPGKPSGSSFTRYFTIDSSGSLTYVDTEEAFNFFRGNCSQMSHFPHPRYGRFLRLESLDDYSPHTYPLEDTITQTAFLFSGLSPFASDSFHLPSANEKRFHTPPGQNYPFVLLYSEPTVSDSNSVTIYVKRSRESGLVKLGTHNFSIHYKYPLVSFLGSSILMYESNLNGLFEPVPSILKFVRYRIE